MYDSAVHHVSMVIVGQHPRHGTISIHTDVYLHAPESCLLFVRFPYVGITMRTKNQKMLNCVSVENKDHQKAGLGGITPAPQLR